MRNADGSFETDRLIVRRFAAGDWADLQDIAKDAQGKPIEFTACRMEMTRADWQSRGGAGGP